METIIDDYKKKRIKYKILSAHSKENLLFYYNDSWSDRILYEGTDQYFVLEDKTVKVGKMLYVYIVISESFSELVPFRQDVIWYCVWDFHREMDTN